MFMTKIILFIILASGLAFAAPGGNVALGGLLASSDLVVVGTISSIVESGPQVDVGLTINRSIKGNGLDGSTITAQWTPTINTSFRGLDNVIGETGIWFLKQTGSTFGVVPVTSGMSPMSEVFVNVPAAVPTASAALTSHGAVGSLVAELNAAAQDNSTASGIFRLAEGGALVDLNDTNGQLLFADLASSPNVSVRALAWAEQLRLGQTAGLISLASADLSALGQSTWLMLTSTICQFTSTDPAAISSLEKLTSSDFGDDMKTCAAHSLRAIHSAAAVVILAGLLDSTSPRLQYEAVAGIASFANGLPVQTQKNVLDMSAFAAPSDATTATDDTRKNFPTMAAFNKQPQAYVTFWKNWLAARAVK